MDLLVTILGADKIIKIKYYNWVVVALFCISYYFCFSSLNVRSTEMQIKVKLSKLILTKKLI